MEVLSSWLAKKLLIWQNLRNESLEGKHPVGTCPLSTEAAAPKRWKEEGMGWLWDLIELALAAAIVLWLFRHHDRLRAVERKVRSLEGGAAVTASSSPPPSSPQENEDE